MIKKSIILISILGLVSFTTKKQATKQGNLNIILYDNHDSKGISLPPIPKVLILKKNIENQDLNTYEEFCEVCSFSIIGKWKVEKDTLYLTPTGEFHYDSIPRIFEIDPDNPKYFHESLIRQKWLIKGDHIYERTDYSVFNEYDDEGNLLEDASSMANPNNSLRLRTKERLK